MSLQSSVFENGEWVTRDMTTTELIRKNGHSHRPTIGRQPPVEPPTCGLLTRTIVDSPVTRWILPVRLRSSSFNDVAFIGENYVQIYELDESDTQLHDIGRKRDFSAKIRNAAIIGPVSRHAGDGFADSGNPDQDSADIDIDMSNSDARSSLPPQILVLVLENGQVLFLYMTRTPSNHWIFEAAYWSLPASENTPIPLHYLSVDPSSRYICFGHTTTFFIICELETMDTLRQRHRRGLALDPVRRLHIRPVSGSIGNISFLHPSEDGELHVILLIIMIQPGGTKLAYYEWEHGHEELREVFNQERKGLKLHDDFRLPLMVIPLTVRSAFIIVTEGNLTTISGLLEGSLEYHTIDLDTQDPTDLHHGRSHPLCVAWTRPVREAQFHEKNDVIYLVREDGVINFLEVGVDTGIETSLEMGEVDCNFDTAFACMYDRFGDVLLAGGESGPGAMWNISPKDKLQLIKKFPNWAPMVDLTVMPSQDPMVRHRRSAQHNFSFTTPRDGLKRSDRLFGCSGKGRSGVITEFRHGLEARIGIELSYPTVIQHCWVVPKIHAMPEDSTILLLALPDSTSVLRFRETVEDAVEELSELAVPWDLSARTLAFAEHEGVFVQVTATSITVATGDYQNRMSTHDLFGGTQVSIIHAFAFERRAVLAVRSGSQQKVVILQTSQDGVVVDNSFDVTEEITCLSLTRLDGDLVTLVGTWHDRSVQLAVYPGSDTLSAGTGPILLSLQCLAGDVAMGTESNLCPEIIEPLTSLVPLGHESNTFCVAAGTRSGEVLTIRIQPGHHAVRLDKLGVTPVHVQLLSVADEPITIMATNNDEPIWMSDLSVSRSDAQFKQKIRVWATDASDPNFPTLTIGAVARVPPQESVSWENMNLILVSDDHIRFSELHTRARPLMRQFSTNGTPTKVRYDANCNALVTAVIRDGRSKLCLFDPETGTEISEPRTLVATPDGRRQPQVCEQIDGLSIRGSNEPAVRILCLDAWSIRQEAHTFPHLLLGCRVEPKGPGGDVRGLLLVIKVEPTIQNSAAERRVPIIRKYASKFAAPITAVASHDQGVFVCFGNTAEYLTIDLQNRKLKTAKRFELPSAARSLQVKGDWLYVVTVAHSLLILDYRNDALGPEHMVLVLSDEMSRRSLDVIEAGSFLEHDRRQSITMLADMGCGIHGLWSSGHEDSPLIPVFQAESRASILKFGLAKIRAPWDMFNRSTKFGYLQSGKDSSDIVGISIDGALHHFSLIDEQAWRLLRFLQNLAMAAPSACSYRSPPYGFDTYGPEPQSSDKLMMHVDGDILQQCLESRALEGLVCEERNLVRLQQLLDELVSPAPGGPRSARLGGTVDFDLVYEILEYHLCPVL